MTERTMPPLPCGSVDLDALHAADAKKADLDEAIAKALVPTPAAAEAIAAERKSTAKAEAATKADEALGKA